MFRHLTYCSPKLGAGDGQMKILMRRWILGFAMLFMFAGIYMPPKADAQVVVKVGGGHHRHYRHHYHRSYRR
jgi:hypothetical protein